MDSENPYASPRYTAADAGTEKPAIDAATIHGARRYGKYLIVRRDAELPNLCTTCGLRADGPLRRAKLNWTDPWSLRTWLSRIPTAVGLIVLYWTWTTYSWIAFFLLSIVSGWIGHTLVRQATVYYRRCALHEARRRRLPWLVGAFVILGVSAFAAGVWTTTSTFAALNQSNFAIGMFVLAVICWVLAMLCAIDLGARIEVQRIDEQLVWLRKLPSAFLAQIPEISAAELIDWTKTAQRTDS